MFLLAILIELDTIKKKLAFFHWLEAIVQLAKFIHQTLDSLCMYLPLFAEAGPGLTLPFPHAKNSAVMEYARNVGVQVGVSSTESPSFQGFIKVGWIGLNGNVFEVLSEQMCVDSSVVFAGVDGNSWMFLDAIGSIVCMNVRDSYRSLMSMSENGHRKAGFITYERILDLAASLGIRSQLPFGSNPVSLEARCLYPLTKKRFEHNGLDPPRP